MFSIGAIATNAIFLYGIGVGPIFLDDVQCTGAEVQLLECPSNGLGRHDCGHSEDVAVICNRIEPVTPCKYTLNPSGDPKQDCMQHTLLFFHFHSRGIYCNS